MLKLLILNKPPKISATLAILSRKMNHSRGFTLIELLITVGIISIIMAIAVPNFLEAKVRTRIAKVRSEMNTIELALNSFAVDRYTCPTVYTPDFISRLIPLTTPVAYLKEIPADPFAEGLPPSMKSTQHPDWITAYKIRGKLVFPFPYEYMYHNPGDDWHMISSNPSITEWALKSVGPGKEPVWFTSKLLLRYDPSNGTMSSGQIILTGPGLKDDGPNR